VTTHECVCVCVCEGYTSKGTNERVEATPRHATPKNPRDSAVFCEQTLRVRNFITRRADRQEQFPLPRKFVSFIEKTPIRPDRYACRMQFQVVNIILMSIKARGEISWETEGRF